MLRHRVLFQITIFMLFVCNLVFKEVEHIHGLHFHHMSLQSICPTLDMNENSSCFSLFDFPFVCDCECNVERSDCNDALSHSNLFDLSSLCGF